VKAFKVFARNSYGNNRFEYPIFSKRDYPEYQSFLLRASDQDWDMTFMRDSVLTSLAKDTSVMYQETEVGVCYLNGEYHSLYNLRERVSVHSICQFEGWEGMENDIDLVKANSGEKQGSNATFEELLDYCKNNDTTTQAFYDYLDTKIDIQNYIEYMSLEIFTGNGDTLNVKRYRNAKADGKWRWVLFDLDWAFFVDTNSIGRWLKPGGMGTNLRTDNTLFIACMKNPIFREQFLTYFGEQLATTFSTENTVSLFMERYELIDGLLPDYQAKWSLKPSGMANSMKKLKAYCETRPTKILGYFQETFKFSEAEFYKYFGDAVAEIERYAAENPQN
ncbi:MAG: CotH kinase family protein, partial [Clostridia bacterium]|nr:CotH kinase family protein [Clostridia bacterium]